MAEIVNLRRHRKTKLREEKEAAAAENRARFGRTKAEKAFDERKRRTTDTFLDRQRIDRGKPDDEASD